MSTASSDLAIAVQGVTKRYGDFTAVNDLSFEVRCGELFAMLGPNGAGKTTTIRMILDILKPDTGSIEILGGSISEKTKDRIGYLPEERGLYRNVPVIQVLTYLGQLKGMTRSDATNRAVSLLDQFDLGENQKHKVSELSKGMQQKVQIIGTILHKPDLIIIDEPFSGLDPVNTQLIKDMLYQMNSEGVTIIMSTHVMQQIEEMAGRLVMIDRGMRVLYGGVEEVRQRYAKNAVIVEGNGDWHALEGVRMVEPNENGRGMMLHLADGVTPDDIMARMAANTAYHVRRFELAVPSLTEIFIQVAGGSRANGGANHQGR
ncbi:MAG: ATP-binding cassette domain-containing protein [Chloroflexi bacterium]|nr:ATP-binding cassette domain-containing protein [Chloroflexota bacterium]